ncbi:MAG: hypothetical protein ACKO5K_14130 [Armatimonadota bacterium]
MIDFVVADADRWLRYAGELPGFDLRLVVLVPGVEIALERDRVRPEKTVAARWAHLDDRIRREFADTGLWIDNARCGVDSVVERVLDAPRAAFRFDKGLPAR